MGRGGRCAENQVTHLSRRWPCSGPKCVIPAKAGIQVCDVCDEQLKLGPGLRRGDGDSVIPAKAGIQGG